MLHFLKLMTGSPLTQVSLFKCCVFTFYPFLQLFCETVLYWMLWYLLGFLFSNEKVTLQLLRVAGRVRSASCQPSTETALAKEHHCLQWLVCLGYKDTTPCPNPQLCKDIPASESHIQFSEASFDPAANSIFPSIQTCYLLLLSIISLLRINESNKALTEK